MRDPRLPKRFTSSESGPMESTTSARKCLDIGDGNGSTRLGAPPATGGVGTGPTSPTGTGTFRRPIPDAPYGAPPVPERADGAGVGRSGVPPQTVLLVGVTLFVGSCLLGLLSSIGGGSGAGVGLAFCAGPIGFIAIIVGLVMLVTRRPNRRPL